MIKGIILTFIVLTVLSYYGFDLNATGHLIVGYIVYIWNVIKYFFGY